MSFFTPAPTPKSGLGYYRKLSTLAGAHVSPIALGGASLGTSWGGSLGVDKEGSFEPLDAYFGLGGNFIDTANAYNQGESEEFIGNGLSPRVSATSSSLPPSTRTLPL